MWHVTTGDQRERGKLFNEVPALYEQVRPSYPDELFADLVAVTGVDTHSSVLEIGCGTGQATRPLAQLGCAVTAIEPGVEMADMARQLLARFPNVAIETSTFETWDAHDRRFDLIVAASSWHWIDPSVGWTRAHHVLNRSSNSPVKVNCPIRNARRPGRPLARSPRTTPDSADQRPSIRGRGHRRRNTELFRDPQPGHDIGLSSQVEQHAPHRRDVRCHRLDEWPRATNELTPRAREHASHPRTVPKELRSALDQQNPTLRRRATCQRRDLEVQLITEDPHRRLRFGSG